MNRPRPLLPLVACSAAALVAGCRTDDDFAPPTPPDMSALVSAYAAPTGHLDAEAALEVVQGLAARAGDLKKALLLTTSIVSAVKGVEPDSMATTEGGLVTTRTQALNAIFEFWQEVQWACYGPDGAEAPIDPQWGRISLNTLGGQAGLYPVAWGGFERCVMPFEGERPQVINGDLKAHIPWGEAEGQPFVLDFDGSWLDDAGDEVSARIDFAVIGESLALLQTTSSGSFRVDVAIESIQDILAGGGLTLKDADSEWRCTVSPGLDGGACSVGERTVQW